MSLLGLKRAYISIQQATEYRIWAGIDSSFWTQRKLKQVSTYHILIVNIEQLIS